MTAILVAGLINIETTVRVEGFPIPYTPVRYPFFGVRSTVSGVGYNVAKALATLGHEVRFHALIGDDYAGGTVRQALHDSGISDRGVLSHLQQTPQSAILYDENGQRMIHVDLKDIQETRYPLLHVDFTGVDIAALCNVNFSRPMLQRAKEAGVLVATDVHTIADLDDPYNRDYMAQADILFMSDEHLPLPPEEWVRALWERYATPIVVIGLGAQGALLAVRADQHMERVPARALRPIVNTIGAGDALFSAFVHSYSQDRNPYRAIRKAVLFAGYKIGAVGAAEGFMNAPRLEAAFVEHQANW